MNRTSGAVLLVAFLGGCSAFYQEPEPVRTASTSRPAPVPGPSIPSWGGPGQQAPPPGYQLVDEGAKQRLTASSGLPSTPTRTNPVTPYSVARVGAADPDTPPLPEIPRSYPSAYVSGAAKGDASGAQVIIGKEAQKNSGTQLVRADNKSPAPLPPAPPVPSVTSKEASGPVFLATPTAKPAATAPAVLPPASVATDKAPPAELPADKGGDESDKAKPIPAGAMMRVVSNKRITLNFKVEDVGPSGISNIEVWTTQDCKVWKKHEVSPSAHSFVFDAEDEGIYGFTMLAHSGIGLGKEPPQPGDLPQVWVLVDTTKPVVQMSDCTATFKDKCHTITVQWKATDKNLGSTPITLSYAEHEEGPWTPIASRIENTGTYVWKPTDRVPPKLLVRVEATDLAGNIGLAQTAKPILLDASMPNISIVGVEGGGKE
jgi:hypothetical protein